MANDRDRMTDDRSGGGMGPEGGMRDDRMGGGGGTRERGPREETGDRGDMNRDDVRGIAEEADEEFDDTEEMDDEEEGEEEER
jgi:hypothetical protein